MAKTWILSIAMALLTAAVLAGSTVIESDVTDPIYGFGVRVLPDEELDDFVQCGLSVFHLADGSNSWELPSLRIFEGSSNSMIFLGENDLEVTFKCFVNREQTEVTYEVEGKRNGRLVLDHLATIRL